MVYHEDVPSDTHCDLPVFDWLFEDPLDTICVLIPTSGALVNNSSDEPLLDDSAEVSKLHIPQSLSLKFATARRVLQIDPRCSLVEVEECIQMGKNTLFNEMCPVKDTNNVRRGEIPRDDQVDEQNRFLAARNQGKHYTTTKAWPPINSVSY